jgi:hypothetical protein
MRDHQKAVFFAKNIADISSDVSYKQSKSRKFLKVQHQDFTNKFVGNTVSNNSVLSNQNRNN